MSVFTGRGLGCERGDRAVFSGLDFALGAGEALVLRGGNGAGKTSLLRLMAGLAAPAAGRLLWDGVDIAEDPARHAARLRFVGHRDAVKPALTAAENLRFWARLQGAGGGVPAALARFGLDRLADTPARFLSAGQRRRLALARVAAGTSELWLLDEPTVALDPEGVAAVLGAVEAHRAGGGRCAIATNVPLALAGARALDLDAHAA